ncbi:MAG: hypothetical protein ACYS8Z_16705 [Planctomycetota bacterium]
MRVRRGGAWTVHPRYARVAVRDYGLPSSRAHNVGFRIVLNF